MEFLLDFGIEGLGLGYPVRHYEIVEDCGIDEPRCCCIAEVDFQMQLDC